MRPSLPGPSAPAEGGGVLREAPQRRLRSSREGPRPAPAPGADASRQLLHIQRETVSPSRQAQPQANRGRRSGARRFGVSSDKKRPPEDGARREALVQQATPRRPGSEPRRGGATTCAWGQPDPLGGQGDTPSQRPGRTRVGGRFAGREPHPVGRRASGASSGWTPRASRAEARP